MTENFFDKRPSSILLENDPETLTRIIDFEIKSYFDYAQNGGESHYDGKNIVLDRFNEEPLSMKEFAQVVSDEILGRAIYKSRPEYLSFVDNGASSANVLAAPLISLMQQNMTTHLTDAPGATMNEISLLLLLRKLAGYSAPEAPKNLLEIGGNFVSGGMMGNMEAVLIARNNLFPDAQKKGFYGSKPVKIILPYFASHYSLWSAFGWMGFGEENAVYVDTKDFRYDINKFAKTVRTLKENEEPVLMAVASLGDSYSMTIENVRAVSEICREHNIWLHGDGANGANIIFSRKHREVGDSIHLCDSITLDPHKALGLNYPCSAFLCRKPETFNSVVSHWNIVNRPDSLDLGMITPFLNSRGFDSLRLWLALRLFGLRGFAQTIDNKIDMTKEIYKDLKELGEKVHFWSHPKYLAFLFQVVPPSMAPMQPSALDQEGRKNLGHYQEAFKKFLKEKTGINLHSFGLPTSVLTGKEDERNNFCNILALHNGHENLPEKLRRSLVNAVNDFTSENDMKPTRDGSSLQLVTRKMTQDALAL